MNIFYVISFLCIIYFTINWKNNINTYINNTINQKKQYQFNDNKKIIDSENIISENFNNIQTLNTDYLTNFIYANEINDELFQFPQFIKYNDS